MARASERSLSGASTWNSEFHFTFCHFSYVKMLIQVQMPRQK